MAGVLASISIGALLLAGCGSAPTTSATSTGGTTHQHGTIVYALPPLVSINWYQPLRPAPYNSAYDAEAASMMYKGLFHIGKNAKVNFNRSIASSIKWNSQGTLYTIKINPKWHWSNGQSVTANDVLFTWNLIKAASSSSAPAPWPYANADFGGIPNLVQSVNVVNSHEFTVQLTQSVNQLWFEYNGLSQFIPLPEKAWNKYPNNINQELSYIAQNGNNPSFFKVTDGPFVMKSAVQNQAWTFVPNPKYNGHKPYISRLIMAYQTSDNAEVNQLQTGTVQIGYLPPSELGVQSQLTQDRLVQSFGYMFTRMFLNYGSPTVGSILRQLPVRQAMQMGIDQNTIIQHIYQGRATYGTGPIPTHPATFLDPQLTKPPYAYDPAAGKALLERNGWHLVNGVMTNAQGQQLKFTMQYVSGNTTTQAIVQLIQQDWAKEGISISLIPETFPSMVGMHRKADASQWEIQAGISWLYGGDYPTGGGMYGTNAAYNFYQYSNPTMDKLIAATHRPYPTPQGSQQALDAYQLFAAKHLPELWMPLAATLTEVQKNVHGVVSSTNSFTGALSPQYWSISK